ncbi:hypothetical protein HAQ00_00730 [Acidithiobacillus caldus ATCC 51756]|uniref:hypothetical protein n=1 Tax=Acidithiobacillus caldus TaxID=33059 RepID=UPI001C07BD19|nr:hypothetical protein [Acidithiobacillus caldus]MBU2734277.1 hypothetical protein [Acidithiobacillus caldus ATCC 51756]MBU2801741.1 hypothetical protein [Acidithiobacillus caldus]
MYSLVSTSVTLGFILGALLWSTSGAESLGRMLVSDRNASEILRYFVLILFFAQFLFLLLIELADMGTKAIGRTVLYRRAAKDVDSWLKRHAFLTLFLVIAGLFGLLLTLSMVKTKAPTPPQADNSLTKPAVSILKRNTAV